jgi:hypothetical protein
VTAKIDRVGHRYGRLTVLQEVEPRVHPSGHISLHWLCRCDCGTVKKVSGKALGSGLTVSCGCYSSDNSRVLHTTHGGTRTPEYRSWRHLVERCTNPNNRAWKDYGGRGITVCDAWRYDFEAFFSHVGKKPTPEHSIDRKNNDRGYEPGNVRWATPTEQANNKRHPPKWSHCKRGHEMTPDNLYIQKKTGARFCKACRDIREARRPTRTKKRAA